MKQQRRNQSNQKFDVKAAKDRAAVMSAARVAAEATGQDLVFWLGIMKWRQKHGMSLKIR